MKNRRVVFKGAGIVLLLLFLWFLVAWPLPSLIESPGSANNLARMVKIRHRPDPGRGKLMLTSVQIAQAHPLSYLWAKVTPDDSLVSINRVTGGESGAAYNRVQAFYMRSAIGQAIFNAYRRAHQSVRRRYRGIYVINVMKNSALRHRLHVGDTITKVNGHHFESAAGYQNYLKRLSGRSRVRINYLHQGRRAVLTSKLVKLPGTQHHGLGVFLTDNVTVRTRLPVHVNSERIGGPSAGLMFALQMYEKLSRHNLTRGRKIAGTGTIGPNGQVGEIGGIDKKVIAARRSGATIFLAPYVKPSKAVLKLEPGHLTNYQLAERTARRDAPGMKVIPVKNFAQAIRYLEK